MFDWYIWLHSCHLGVRNKTTEKKKLILWMSFVAQASTIAWRNFYTATPIALSIQSLSQNSGTVSNIRGGVEHCKELLPCRIGQWLCMSMSDWYCAAYSQLWTSHSDHSPHWLSLQVQHAFVSRTMPKKTQQKPMAFRFPKNQPLHPTSFMHWLCLAWYGKKHRCTDDMLNSI